MSKRKVMIVDDDDVFLEELQGVLSMSGYEVVPFSDGGTALKWAKKEHPDLIMLDIKMDGMDGFQLTKNLKRFQATVRIPVIAMTGHFTQDEHVALMRKCGMETCLKKPFNALDLLTRIEVILSLNGKSKTKGAGWQESK
ncbi:MAG: response regulator [Candidatus Aureabacteria bacterium]|nr:response regulator [Candidatus Auribacterota bacterium]